MNARTKRRFEQVSFSFRVYACPFVVLLLSLPLSGIAATNSQPLLHPTLKSASEAAVADQSLVVLVFGADWCAPCKQLKSRTLASREFAEQGGLLHLVEVDVDADANLARAYGVEAVPTLVLMTGDNKIVSRRTGFMETADLLLWLREGRDLAKAGKWEGTAPGSKVREFIAQAAEPLSTNDFVRLIEMLGEPGLADRQAAAELLMAQREQAVLPLIDALTNSYLGVRISASEVLGQWTPESMVVNPWQAPAELAETAAALRKWWADTGKLPVRPPQTRLDPAATASIASALEDLRGNDPALRTRAMSTLVTRGAATLPAVRAAIKLSDKAGDQRSVLLLEDVRWAILVPDVVDQRASGVRTVLARGKGPERQAAVARLGRAGREALPPLAELVEDSDPLVVESAVRALSSVGGQDAIPAMAVLLKAGDPNLRMTAAQALGRTKNSTAIKELLPVFEDPNEIVASTALSALEEINAARSYSPNKTSQGPEVIQALKKSLADPRWRVRAAAAEIAGKLEVKELIPELQGLLDDTDGFVVKNALEALRKLSATPEPEKLVRTSERHPGLRGDVVELLVKWSTDDAVKAVTGMYNASPIEGRLAILNSFGSPEGNRESTAWQPLLAQAAADADPRLRRAAATALSTQPPSVAAALVGPLLSDDDAETRSNAAEAVLSIMGGERSMRSGSHTVEVFEFASDSSEISFGSGRATQTAPKPAATVEQIAAWHAALQQKCGTSPDLLAAAAIYVTGDTNADLPVLQQALESADKEALARFNQSAALAAIMPRLPWPAAQPVIERFSAVPVVLLHSLNYLHKSAAGIMEFVLEPARFRKAVEPASLEDLGRSLPRLLTANQRNFTLLTASPQIAHLLTALLDSTNAAWRAAAVYALGIREQGTNTAVFEKAARDSNAWVRVAAVPALARAAKERSTLEQRVGPLLGDSDKQVVRRASLALLEPQTRAAASLEYGWDNFQFEKIYAWGAFSYNPTVEQRPLNTLEGKPPFLEQARQHLGATALEDVFSPALLLAQYGDFSGLDRVLALAKSGTQPQSEFDGVIGAMIALSRDPKYLPYLKEMAANAKQEPDFRRLLQALKGVPGAEARELRLEINKRLRQ